MQVGISQIEYEKKEKNFLYQNIEKEVLTYIVSASNKLIRIPSNVFLLPLITTDLFYLEKMNGVLAHTDGETNIFIYLNNDKKVDSKFIKSICFHEYQHVVRNSIVKQEKNKTLLDVIIDEGCSELFVQYTLGKDYVGEWATSLTTDEIKKYLERFRHKLYLTEANEIQKFMYGNSSEYPLWLGYSIGYRIVNDFMSNEPTMEFEDLIRHNPFQVYYKSNYYR